MAFLHVRLSHAHFQSTPCVHATDFLLSSVAFLLSLLNLRLNEKKREILLRQPQYSMQILNLLHTVWRFWRFLFVNWQCLEPIGRVNYILD